MKVSLIATVRNEHATIEALLTSIAAQSLLPDQVVIADGGSSDNARHPS
jgi:glycosyltransferase involved in cell wall biosynthesis